MDPNSTLQVLDRYCRWYLDYDTNERRRTTGLVDGQVLPFLNPLIFFCTFIFFIFCPIPFSIHQIITVRWAIDIVIFFAILSLRGVQADKNNLLGSIHHVEAAPLQFIITTQDAGLAFLTVRHLLGVTFQARFRANVP